MKERLWTIGEKHPEYGTVQMMGTTGGEKYRWFVDEQGTVSMIPLTFLQEGKVKPSEQ